MVGWGIRKEVVNRREVLDNLDCLRVCLLCFAPLDRSLSDRRGARLF